MTDISYYLSLPYAIRIWRDEDADFMATIPELDGCRAHGSTREEALNNLAEAQSAWLEHAIHAGRQIPVPEVEEELPSGKFVVRVGRFVHQKLNRFAKRDGVSLNNLVTDALGRYIGRREGQDEASRLIDSWRHPDTHWTGVRRPAGVRYLRRVQAKQEIAATGVMHQHTARQHRQVKKS